MAPNLAVADLVLNRSLRGRIDDQYFQGRLARFQFKPQRLQILKERLVRRALQEPHEFRGKHHTRVQGRPNQQDAVFLRRELEREIVGPLEVRHVHYGALDEAPQGFGQLCHGELPGFEAVVGEREVGPSSEGERGAARAALGGDVDAGLGFRIERRLFQLQSALADHHAIDRELLRFAVQFELEALLQEGLQHLRNLLARGPGGQLGVDIEPVRRDPVGPRDLVFLHSVGDADVVSYREVGAVYRRAVNLHTDVDLCDVWCDGGWLD